MSNLVKRAGLFGRTAVIIGGGGGIGAAVTLALAGEGVKVAFCDIDEDQLSHTSAAVEKLDVDSLAKHVDVENESELDHFFDLVEERFGHIEILVNIVGGTVRRNFSDGNREVDSRDYRLNYGYVIDSSRRALPLLRRSENGGSIINFTTIEAHRGAATFAVYAGAKAATTNFSSALAVELASEAIRVNCIAPDSTPSAGNVAAVPGIVERFGSLPPGIAEKGMEMYIPAKQPPMPEDLADGVLFLASDLSRFVTGTTLHVDGGTKAASGFLNWPYDDGHVPAPLDGTLRKLFSESN